MFKLGFKLLHFWPWFLGALIILFFLFQPSLISIKDHRLLVKVIDKDRMDSTSHLPLDNQSVTTNIIPENILVFGGDIMLSRTVNTQMEKYKNYTWPLEKISGLFKEADLAAANLESPFLITNNYSVLSGSFSFKANPLSVAALSVAGIDVVSLANNHILNQGEIGLKDTGKILDEAGVGYVGIASSNLVVKESKGVKFAFLAYTYATDSKLIASMLDIPQAESDIKKAKSQADVVIVMMHAGNEYTSTPNSQQIKFAHAAISAGADIIVGSHPHWPQTVENYQGKTIIYSLGNLVFDQMWSKKTSQGLVAKIYFKGKQLDKIEYIPISIKNFGQAEIMPDGLDKDKLLELIGLNK